MVRGRERVGVRGAARRVVAPAVSDPRDHPRLVVGDPVTDPVAETARNGFDVLAERIDGPADRPAALILDRLRRVPMEERDVRRDPAADELVDEPVVEVEALRIHRPATSGMIRGHAIEKRNASIPSSRMSAMSSR